MMYQVKRKTLRYKTPQNDLAHSDSLLAISPASRDVVVHGVVCFPVKPSLRLSSNREVGLLFMGN